MGLGGAAAFRVVPQVMVVPYLDVRLLGTQPQVTGGTIIRRARETPGFANPMTEHASHDIVMFLWRGLIPPWRLHNK